LIVALVFKTEISFLWYNVIGCAVVVALSLILQTIWPDRASRS
jgi:hypothetical protein